MGVANLGLMPDHTQNVGLVSLGVDGIAHRLAIEGQTLVLGRHLRIPALQRRIEGVNVNHKRFILRGGTAP